MEHTTAKIRMGLILDYFREKAGCLPPWIRNIELSVFDASCALNWFMHIEARRCWSIHLLKAMASMWTRHPESFAEITTIDGIVCPRVLCHFFFLIIIINPSKQFFILTWRFLWVNRNLLYINYQTIQNINI